MPISSRKKRKAAQQTLSSGSKNTSINFLRTMISTNVFKTTRSTSISNNFLHPTIVRKASELPGTGLQSLFQSNLITKRGLILSFLGKTKDVDEAKLKEDARKAETKA